MVKSKYICNRCGRDDFINGHALGGHKKYCQKPEYEAGRKKNLKRKYKSKIKKNNDWNLSNIVKHIHTFTFKFEQENEITKKKLSDLLDTSLEKNDLEELETIHWYLHEGKNNLVNIINECYLLDDKLN
mgnify:CR=1 FL=1|jgi:hypothetical protein